VTAEIPRRAVTDFLGDVAARQTAPAAGSVAAVTVGAAAALVAKAARFSQGEPATLADRADVIRAAVLRLADADGAAYGALLTAFRLPRDRPDRRNQIDTALRDAVDVPLRIGEAAAEIAELAARLAREGNRNLAGDAQTAAALAEGAAGAAARLVRINHALGTLPANTLTRAAAAEQAARTARAAALPDTASP
jgi:formiminotetrahydrofolate cyclodeaminase